VPGAWIPPEEARSSHCADGKAVVKEDTPVDEVALAEEEETIAAAVARLMEAQGSLSDAPNWEIRAMNDDFILREMHAARRERTASTADERTDFASGVDRHFAHDLHAAVMHDCPETASNWLSTAASMADLDVQHILQEAADKADAADEVRGRPRILAAPASLLDAADVDVQPAARGPRKRKAVAPRKPWPSELCPGRAGRACLFSLRPDAFGQPASLQKGDKTCMWCDPERLNQTLQVPQRRKHVTRALRIWTDADAAAVLARAWEVMPVEHHARLHAALQRPSRAQGAIAARKAAAAATQSWEGLLDRRVNLGLPVAENAEAVYRAKTADDGRRIRSKFGALMQAREAGEADWRSPTAERFERWSGGPRKNTLRRCPHCRAGIGYPTVSVDMIPAELQNLSLDVLWALRPLEPDVGLPVFAKHGYRVHTDMIRFRRRPQTVTAQIQALADVRERAAAAAAHRHLMASTDSSYAVFVQMHERFLRRNRASLTGEADDPLLRLPRRALEEEGLECAVWPHLYPRTAMCETYIRKADSRRRERQGRRAAQPAAGVSSASEDEQFMDADDDPEGAAIAEPAPSEDEAEAAAPLDFARPGRNSAKAAYLAKVLGPVLGYGADYELFQFVYDLWLWSVLGAKKNTVDAPLRLAMAGYSFSPEYWQTRHAALIDVVKQLGLPSLFITIAPYEWSFPFHSWVEDEMKKLLCCKLRLPVAETLHIAHVLAQAAQGPADGSGRKTVLNFFGRLEYQDGKRRRYVNGQEAASQFYHGRGTVHLHLLVWLQHLEAVKLEESLAATVPVDNPVMSSLVEGSQRSWTGSGWPLEPGASRYNPSAGVLRLHHTESDFCRYNADGVPERVRGYVKDVLSSLCCHVDVQMADGRGMLLRYVSSYVPKFSDSFTTEWLADACSDYAVARRVLTDYHPLEPEMALQLAMQWFPQCFAGSTLQRFRVPVPWEGDLPERVQRYMVSTWRAVDMSVVDYLRRTNKSGEIHQAFRKRYQQMVAEELAGEAPLESLETWANGASLRGDVALLELVPHHLYYQTLALLLRPDHWTSEEAIRAELELEAFREHHVRNILAMLFANQGLIRCYLSGELDKNEDVPDDGEGRQAEGLRRRQQRETAWKGEAAQSDDPADMAEAASPFLVAADARSTFAILGGKTTAVHAAIRRVAQAGGRILLTAPTGRLAASLREKFAELEVDTVHGAFLVHKPVQEALEVLWPYDLIIVEEVGQLSKAIFERIMEQWEAAERVPTVVFVGDFYQLPGVDPTSPLDSSLWHSVLVKKRELHAMLRCKCPKLRKTLELLRVGKPTRQQLRQIMAGHKAPSRRTAGYVMNAEPSQDDVAHVLAETPHTLFLTVSRRACAQLNEAAVTALFSEDVPLAVVPGDPESNVANYASGKMPRASKDV
ncbi:unnamed protein product, partial [Symbiodinium necroappetens]